MQVNHIFLALITLVTLLYLVRVSLEIRNEREVKYLFSFGTVPVSLLYIFLQYLFLMP